MKKLKRLVKQASIKGPLLSADLNGDNLSPELKKWIDSLPPEGRTYLFNRLEEMKAQMHLPEIPFDKMSKKEFERLYNEAKLEFDVNQYNDYSEFLLKHAPDKLYCPLCFFNRIMDEK